MIALAEIIRSATALSPLDTLDDFTTLPLSMDSASAGEHQKHQNCPRELITASSTGCWELTLTSSSCLADRHLHTTRSKFILDWRPIVQQISIKLEERWGTVAYSFRTSPLPPRNCAELWTAWKRKWGGSQTGDSVIYDHPYAFSPASRPNTTLANILKAFTHGNTHAQKNCRAAPEIWADGYNKQGIFA